MNTRKALAACLMFFLLGSIVAAGVWQDQEKGKDKEKRKGLGGLFKIKKADDTQKDKSVVDQNPAEELVTGKNMVAGVDDVILRNLRASSPTAGVDDNIALALNGDQSGTQEHPALYTRADVEQHKQKLQPVAAELDDLRREHEELLKKLGVPELTPEEKANVEDKERQWRGVDTRLNEVYNDAIFLSAMSSQPPESAFRSVANQLAAAFQNPRAGVAITAIQTGATMRSGAPMQPGALAKTGAPARPEAPARIGAPAQPGVPAQPGAAYLASGNREAGPSYLNLTRLAVTNTLPAELKLAGQPSELRDAPQATLAEVKKKPEKEITKDKGAKAGGKGKDLAKSNEPTSRVKGKKQPKEPGKAKDDVAANNQSSAKDKPPSSPPKGKGGASPANKQQTETQIAENKSKPEASGEIIAEASQTGGTRGQKTKGDETNSAQNSQTAANAATVTPPTAPAPPVATPAATQPAAPPAPATTTVATSPATPAKTTSVTEVKSPQVEFAQGSAPKPAATNKAATTSKKPADEKNKKSSGIGGFMKDLGKATGKVAQQQIDPQGVERKELNAAARRTYSRIDREDEFLLDLRIKYNQLFAKAKETRARDEKEQLRKELEEMQKKEEELADVYQRIKAKHDLLDRQQNAINLAEDSIHFTSGKYAAGMKNILVARANYVRAIKWPIPKGQWPELYFNRFVCPPGEDCKAAYEKLAQQNFAAVEQAEQAKDEDLKSDKPFVEKYLGRANEGLRKPNKCEKTPFAFENPDGACWVKQEAEGVRVYRSRFPIWEGHRSLETLKDGIATLIVYSAIESLASGRPTLSRAGLLALTGAAYETMLMPRQLSEVSNVYYAVYVDFSYSESRLDFIRKNLEDSLPNGVKVHFPSSQELEQYAKGGSTWFTPNGPTKEMKDFIGRKERERGVKFDAVLEWDSVPNSGATRVRIYSLAAAEQVKGTPLAFEFLYPGMPVEKKSGAAKGQPPELNHFRWFGQEPIPAYKPEGSFKAMTARQAGDTVLDRKEVFLYALNYFAKDMAELHK